MLPYPSGSGVNSPFPLIHNLLAHFWKRLAKVIISFLL
jgi:hypothetical protein